MKKKWFAMMSALMVLVLLFAGLPAMAQTGTVEDVEAVPLPNALVIRAPRVAYVGQEVTIGVFERGTGAPVGGAFVFVLSRDNAEALQAEVATFREDSIAEAGEIDYQTLAEAYGELIGITGNSGEVYHAFDEAGWYMLLAVKGGYYPGFATITIVPVVKALGIKAPYNARVGEEVTITVFERGTQQPAEGALVFEVSPVAAEALQAEITAIREDTTVDAASVDYEELARRYGELIGITNEYGEVYHAFDQAGRYLLIAVKPGHLPGFARIAIWPAVKALGIKAPDTAEVGEEVTIGVFERGTGEPVENAGVWALSRENAEIMKAEVAVLQEETATVDDIDYESLVEIYGEFIDWTDENGEVRHAFDEAGWYLLLAVKPDYLPAFAPIRINTLPKALGIKAPRMARTGDEVTMVVFDWRTQSPVEGAGVWAVSRDNIDILKEQITQFQEGAVTANAEADYESLVSLVGEFIDWTDENGEVRHTFEEPGFYLLVAVKRGYYPGFAPIAIRSLNADSSGNAPQATGVRLVQAVRANGPQLISAQVQADVSQSPQLIRKVVAVRNQVQAVVQPMRIEVVK